MTSFDALETFYRSLPETTVSPSYGGHPALRVNGRLVGWLRGDLEGETDSTGAPYGEVLMLRVADQGEKEALLAAGGAFFTTPHYDGHASVLVRLAGVDEAELRELIVEAWRRAAPKRALARYVESGGTLP